MAEGEEHSFTPLAREATAYLSEAKEQGLLRNDCDVAELVSGYCFVFNGIAFNWCISSARYDIVAFVERRLGNVVDEARAD